MLEIKCVLGYNRETESDIAYEKQCFRLTKTEKDDSRRIS